MDYKTDDFVYDYDAAEDDEGEDGLAFAHTLNAAANGDKESMRLLGYIYSNSGYGVKPDCGKAAYWYEKGVTHGDIPSAVALAELYYRGEKGFPKDYERAYALYTYAADGGSEHSLARLGKMTLLGLGVAADRERGRELIERSLSFGEREALYEYAKLLKEEGDPNWREYLKRSADNSYADACYDEARLLLDEDCVDDRQIINRLTGAACGGIVSAQLLLVKFYLEGKHAKPNRNFAEHYCRLAAESGSREAVRLLEKYFKN